MILTAVGDSMMFKWSAGRDLFQRAAGDCRGGNADVLFLDHVLLGVQHLDVVLIVLRSSAQSDVIEHQVDDHQLLFHLET